MNKRQTLDQQIESIQWLTEDKNAAFEMILSDLTINPFAHLKDFEEEFDHEDSDPLRAAITCAYRNKFPEFIYFAEWYIHFDFTEFEREVHETMIRHFPSRSINPMQTPLAYDYAYPPVDFLGFNEIDDLKYSPDFNHAHIQAFIQTAENDPEDVRAISCQLLEESLTKKAIRTNDVAYLNIVQFLSYVFTGSNDNALFHMTEENYWESFGDAPGWDVIDAIQDDQDEAYERYEMVLKALEMLKTNKNLIRSLIRAYHKTYDLVSELIPNLPKQVRTEQYARYNKLKEIIFDEKRFTRPRYRWPTIALSSEQSLTRTQLNNRCLRFWRDNDNSRNQLSS